VVDTKTNRAKALTCEYKTHTKSVVKKTKEGTPFCIPRKRLTQAHGEKLLEDTKQRQRLLQEARTSARVEQLEIEICEKIGRQLYLEHPELSGELEC
jgi:hypothetical protein